jgi:hypothetical protein
MRTADIIPSIIDEALQTLKDKAGDLWYAIFDPLYVWYVVAFVVVFIICPLVLIYLPFKITRVGAGMTALLTIAFVFGGKVMHDQMLRRVEDERAKRHAAEERAKQSSDGGSSGGFRFPFPPFS